MVDNSTGNEMQDDIFISAESLEQNQDSPTTVPYKNRMMGLDKTAK